MTQESLESKITRLEESAKIHDKRIEKVENSNESITRLTILYENQERRIAENLARQEEKDKKQEERLDKFSETLIQVNENLTNLNSGMKDLSKRVTEIEDKNTNESINHIQQTVDKLDDRVKSIEKRKIDWNEFIHSTFVKVLGTVVTLGVLAWLASQFGMDFLK